MTLTNLAALPLYPQADQPPERLRDDLLNTITAAIMGRPRSQQTRLGPSEIGMPCVRRLAHKLAGTPEVNPRGAAWRPTVGVAVHEWLAAVFTEANRAEDVARWLVEFKVQPGMIGDQVLDGHCDLYDRATSTVIDWKIVGAEALKKYRRSGPGEQYRVQGHTYGLGWVRRGVPVDRVAVMFLPSAAELPDAVLWQEPYNPAIAEAAITRANTIHALVRAAGSAAAGALPTADAHCSYCPWFLPGATDLTEACPGHAEAPRATA